MYSSADTFAVIGGKYFCSSTSGVGNSLPIHVNADKIEPRHEISNNAVCATSKASDQPAHTRSLIRAFASRLSIL